MKLSIGMIVKNEERYLGECLCALKPLMNEIESELIIIDTGSTDRTIDIAKQYTDKVYEHAWENDFAKARNISLSYASGEWFLFLDADEIVYEYEGLVNFLNSENVNKYNAATIKINNILDLDNLKQINVSLIIRLLKRSKNLKFYGALHEQPTIIMPFTHVSFSVNHYGYISTDADLMERKFVRNRDILMKELKENPEDIIKLQQLSSVYRMHRDYYDALYCALKAFNLMKTQKLSPKNYMFLYNTVVNGYFTTGKFEEAEKYASEGLVIQDDNIDLQYYLAFSQSIKEKFEDAIFNLKKYIELSNDINSIIQKDITTSYDTVGFVDEAYSEIAYCYFRLKKYDEALEYIYKIDIHSKSIMRILAIVITIFIELEQYDKLQDFHTYLSENELVAYEYIKVLEVEKAVSNYNRYQISRIENAFVADDNSYGILNQARLILEGINTVNRDNFTQKAKLILEKAHNIDFTAEESFYADILYLLFKAEINFIELLIGVKEEQVKNYFSYIINKNINELDDIISKIIFKDYTNCTIDEIMIYKALVVSILQEEKISKNNFETITQLYLKLGILYVSGLYNNDIVYNQKLHLLTNNADRFLISMKKAIDMQEVDIVEYVKYLRFVLAEYPYMGKLINVLINQVELENEDETENYKVKIKKSINSLIESGDINSAKEIIGSYKKAVVVDSDIYALECVIGVMEGDLESALNSAESGLAIYPEHIDLLYNKAYILEQSGDVEASIECYKKIYKLTDDESLKLEVFEVLKEKLTQKPIQHLADNTQDIKKKKEIVFLPYKASMWDSLESVWKAATEDENCEVYVVPIPYYDKNPDGGFDKFHYEGFEYPSYVPITYWGDYDIKSRKPDIIYIHNPYDEYNIVTSVHPNFYSSKIKDYTKAFVYIPYFNCVNDHLKNTFCFLPGTVYADKIIAESEKVRSVYIDVFKESMLLNKMEINDEMIGNKFVSLGSPKYDKAISSRYEKHEIPVEWQKIMLKDDGNNKIVVLFDITIGYFLENSNKILTKIKTIFKKFQPNKEISLIYRPHPLLKTTIKNMRSHLLSEYEEIEKEFLDNNSIIYDQSADLYRAISISDIYYGGGEGSLKELSKKAGKKIINQDADIVELESEWDNLSEEWISEIISLRKANEQIEEEHLEEKLCGAKIHNYILNSIL